MLSCKQIEFFKTKVSDEKTLSQIVAHAEFIHVPKGKWIFREGDRGDLFYLVLHGSCAVV